LEKATEVMDKLVQLEEKKMPFHHASSHGTHCFTFVLSSLGTEADHSSRSGRGPVRAT